jgi:hypothetical protein
LGGFADDFYETSRGDAFFDFVALFNSLKSEPDDSYFDQMREHHQNLQFRHGVLTGANSAAAIRDRVKSFSNQRKAP